MKDAAQQENACSSKSQDVFVLSPRIQDDCSSRVVFASVELPPRYLQNIFTLFVGNLIVLFLMHQYVLNPNVSVELNVNVSKGTKENFQNFVLYMPLQHKTSFQAENNIWNDLDLLYTGQRRFVRLIAVEWNAMPTNQIKAISANQANVLKQGGEMDSKHLFKKAENS